MTLRSKLRWPFISYEINRWLLWLADNHHRNNQQHGQPLTHDNHQHRTTNTGQPPTQTTNTGQPTTQTTTNTGQPTTRTTTNTGQPTTRTTNNIDHDQLRSILHLTTNNSHHQHQTITTSSLRDLKMFKPSTSREIHLANTIQCFDEPNQIFATSFKHFLYSFCGHM